METRPNDRIELRVRLRRIQANNEEDGDEVRPGSENITCPVATAETCSSSSTGGSSNQAANSCGPWDTASVRDETVSVRFKLADAVECKSGSSMSRKNAIDWQRLNTMIFYEGYMAVRAAETRSSIDEAAAALTSSLDASPENRLDLDPVDSVALTHRKEQIIGTETRTSDSPLQSISPSPIASDDEPDERPNHEDPAGLSFSVDESDLDGSPNHSIVDASPDPLSATNVTDVHIDIYSAKALKLSLRGPVLSIVNDKNRSLALAKVISLPPFNPFMPQLQMQLIIKPIIPLSELSFSANNVVEVEIKKSRILEFFDDADSTNQQRIVSPFLDLCNIYVRHDRTVFYTFCCCKTCSDYREIVIHIMVEQFKAAHMVVMLLDVLMKAYGPMLSKNRTAYGKFERLLESNKEVYWITCGFVYHKKAEHMDFIYDESLSDKMILVLFSSILMVNNPVLLLQILAFHVECVVKAYAEGFAEIVEPDKKKIPAKEMLHYILHGYNEICRISEQVSVYLFSFENDFLSKFSLTWKLLCQRLYQQHVFSHLTDTMLACILTLKEDHATADVAPLIKEYLDFDDDMNSIENRWIEVWLALNKFNLIETERQRRRSLLDVYSMFDTVVQDAIVFSLQEDNGDGDIYDFHSLENRRLAWQNIMAFTKMKWPDGFFAPPNILVRDDRCRKCSEMVEYHTEGCRCITCSIAGSPLPPSRVATNICYKCAAQNVHEPDFFCCETQYARHAGGIGASSDCDNRAFGVDDHLMYEQSDYRNDGVCGGSLDFRRRNTTLQQLGRELLESMSEHDKEAATASSAADDEGVYHVAWALFHHLKDRKRYTAATIEQKHFCTECKSLACLVARSVLSNGMSLPISMHLVEHYQPVALSRDELRSILPNIMFYNLKMVASDLGLEMTDVHDLVVKMYWTFVISVYATYFIKIDERSALNVDAFELADGGDIRLRRNSIVGNELDTKFFDFLDKVKSLSPYQNELQTSFAFTVDVHADDFQKNLDKFFNLLEKHQQLPSAMKAQQAATPPTVKNAPIPGKATTVVDTAPKKDSKEKGKKCKQGCFDHPELGEHCKENHTNNKKRLKKECNHARMNETRDRLRKKLSKMVNARKGSSTSSAVVGDADCLPSTSSAAAESAAQAVGASTAGVGSGAVTTKQPPSLKSAAANAAAAAAAATASMAPGTMAAVTATSAAPGEDDSLECLNTLCQRISHLDTGPPTDGDESHTCVQMRQKAINITSESLSASSSAMPHGEESGTKRDANNVNLPKAENNSSTCKKNNNNNQKVKDHNNDNLALGDQIKTPTPSQPLALSSKEPNGEAGGGDEAAPAAKTTGGEIANGICELLENNIVDQSKVKKWINEALSFIEGSYVAGGASGGGAKKQPQPTNPKKAAKKAKQKQRKEEEKRVTELLDLRAQFHDLYFKEFADKLQLREIKASKKRDKRRISELEANVKKLQRAKGSLETSILEMIATIKQSNQDFRFSYLPTKEQQLEKIKEIERSQSTTAAQVDDADGRERTPAPPTIEGSDGEVGVANVHISNPAGSFVRIPYPYPQQSYHHQQQPPPHAASTTANHYPPFHEIDYQGTYDRHLGRAFSPTSPMCYAPPQQQQLSPDVVAAMAANTSCRPTADPAKRIVTIRRVNLPNVPEPQVTVTAKGSSPDKDKLLYTFVNGQLVVTQQGNNLGATEQAGEGIMSQMSAPLTVPLQPHVSSIPKHMAARQEQPPLPPLSKKQLKKERRRLEKIAAEAAALAAAAAAAEANVKAEQRALLEKEQRQLEESTSVSCKKKKKKRREAEAEAEIAVAVKIPRNSKKQQQLQDKLSSSASSNSISTIAATRRSASTTTSGSAGGNTSISSSLTPSSSRINTRDNSSSSLQINAAEGVVVSVSVSSQQPAKKTKPQKKQQQQQQQQSNNKVANTNNNKKKQTPIGSGATATSQQPISAPQPQLAAKVSGSGTATEDAATIRTKKQRRTGAIAVDGGNKFENNPFKSLNTPDSESDQDHDAQHAAVVDGSESIAQAAAIGLPKLGKHKVEPLQQQQQQQMLERASIRRSASDIGGGGDGKWKKKREQPATGTTTSATKMSQPSSARNASASKNSVSRAPTAKEQQQQQQQQQQLRQATKKLAADQVSGKTATLAQSKALKGRQAPSGGVLAGASANGSSSKRGGGGGDRKSGNEQRSTLQLQAPTATVVVGNVGPTRTGGTSGEAKPLSKRAQKQAQRNKKAPPQKQLPVPVQQQQQRPLYEDDGRAIAAGGGLPRGLPYFNPHEAPPPIPININKYQLQQQQQHLQQLQQQQQLQSITQQMQGLRVCGGGGSGGVGGMGGMAQQQPHGIVMPSYASVSNGSCCPSFSSVASNVSIMDQLNRGVQVENLSLPPGITLTKVDPAKSEQLRQKSESIRMLAKPLKPQPPPSTPAAYHAGATIIAPSVGVASASYYGTPPPPYGLAAHHDHSGGIIMVEANGGSSRTQLPPLQTRASTSVPLPGMAAPTADANATKTSKSKKRRNKAKAAAEAARPDNKTVAGGNAAPAAAAAAAAPKMVTLRNPMFHGGPASAAAAATLLQQPPPQSHPSVGLISGRGAHGGLSLPPAPMLSMDQPAAIIKNDNGMFTIRNPALHQAVTNGMAMGGYRQFGNNVNYYTPQEAAAEAARATQQSAAAASAAASAAVTRTSGGGDELSNTSTTSESTFSYFSSVSSPATSIEQQSTTQHNNISISCTSIGDGRAADSAAVGHCGGLSGDAAIVARPMPPQKCISAIGSEVKSAQQQKLQQLQCNETEWRNFLSLPSTTNNENFACGGGGYLPTSNYHHLQQQQQQQAATTGYYNNGFDVFAATVGGRRRSSNSGTLFDGGDCHRHHNCGDDSPPPTITGFNSYLDGIAPNTGVIRYDDASFLKHLIPGQNLNNEVSIHNVNDSNFGRNASSPAAHHHHNHRVEITPVYANRATPTSAYDRCTPIGAVGPPHSNVHSLPQAHHPSSLTQPPPRKFFSNSVSNYCDNFADYSANSKLFAPSHLPNLHELDTSERDRCREGLGPFARYNYGFETPTETTREGSIDINDLMVRKSPHSPRTSPYLGESTMDSFAQNLGALQISTTASTDEHSGSTSGGISNCDAAGGKNSDNGGGAGGDSGNNASDSGIDAANGWW